MAPHDVELENHRLRSELSGLQEILSSLGALVFTKDNGCRYTYANAPTCAWLAHPLSEVVGQDDSKFFDADNVKRIQAVDRMVMATGEKHVNQEKLILSGSGQTRDYLTVKAPLFNKDRQVVGVCGVAMDVTDRVMFEQQLSQSRQLLETVLDNVGAHIYMKAEDGRYLYANRFFLESANLTLDQVLGRKDTDLFPISNLEALRTVDAQVFATGQLLQVEEQLVDANGVNQHYWSTKLILKRDGEPDCLIGLSTPISKLKAAEETLRQSESRFRALSDSSLIGIFQEEGGRLIYVNAALARIFGYTVEELTGTDFMMLIPVEDHQKVNALFQQLESQRTDSAQYEIRGLCKNGELRNIEIYSVRLHLSDKPSVLCTLIDVTERNHAAQKLAIAYDNLEKSLEDTIATMAKIVEMRDPYTAGHQDRVAKLAVAIAQEMELQPELVKRLRMAAMIHNVGKVGIPADLLTRPRQLSTLEFEIMKNHVQLGYEIVKNMNLLQGVPDIIRQHHERMDGSGYPAGLKGNDILLEARILGVADTVVAMASHRLYRPSLGLEAALDEIIKGSGTRYDATVCEACLRLFQNKGYALPA